MGFGGSVHASCNRGVGDVPHNGDYPVCADGSTCDESPKAYVGLLQQVQRRIPTNEASFPKGPSTHDKISTQSHHYDSYIYIYIETPKHPTFLYFGP